MTLTPSLFTEWTQAEKLCVQPGSKVRLGPVKTLVLRVQWGLIRDTQKWGGGTASECGVGGRTSSGVLENIRYSVWIELGGGRMNERASHDQRTMCLSPVAGFLQSSKEEGAVHVWST